MNKQRSYPHKKQIDMRAKPVKRIVALGESTTWGYSVSKKEKCWVNQVSQMLQEFQGSSIELINQGVGSNILTTKCPMYDIKGDTPALERVDADLISLNPDMKECRVRKSAGSALELRGREECRVSPGIKL